MVLSVLRRMRYIYGADPEDNFVMKLCYRWTVLLLVTFSFIVTCRILLGDSIACTSSSTMIDNYMITKCYQDGVFSMPVDLLDIKGFLMERFKRFRRYNIHYSWVNLLFLVHAFIFYLPHLLWKYCERGHVFRLTAGVQKLFDKEEKRGLELRYLAKYALVTQGTHEWYTGMYIFFEVCNCVISLALNVWLIFFFDVTGLPNFTEVPEFYDRNGQPVTFPKAIKTWSDFKDFYFPSQGACAISRWGSSGDIVMPSIFCELPLNSLYMKMFLFLRAWYSLLTHLTALVLIYRCVLLAPPIRIFVMRLTSPLSENSVVTRVCSNMSYSDWFFLSRLQKTMIDIDFAHMVHKISLVSTDDFKNLRGQSLFQEGMVDLDFSNVTSAV